METARAASFPTEHLDDLIADTQVKVEAVTGRKLQKRPGVRITVAPMAIDEMRAAYATRFPEWGPDQIDRRIGVSEFEGSIARYSPGGPTMYLLDDRLASIFRGRGTPDELRAGLLTCTLAHELTHALQHQEQVLGADRSDGAEALIEGQATWVAGQSCSGAGQRFMRDMKGLDVLASMAPDARLPAALRAILDLGLATVPPTLDSTPDALAILDKYAPPATPGAGGG